jgi:hypothetical protein
MAEARIVWNGEGERIASIGGRVAITLDPGRWELRELDRSPQRV